jgi:hypothetical protein
MAFRAFRPQEISSGEGLFCRVKLVADAFCERVRAGDAEFCFAFGEFSKEAEIIGEAEWGHGELCGDGTVVEIVIEFF